MESGEIAILTVGAVLGVLEMLAMLGVLDVLDMLDMLDVLEPSPPPQLLSIAIAKEAAEKTLRCRIFIPRCR